jgi:hypothetical protein
MGTITLDEYRPPPPYRAHIGFGLGGRQVWTPVRLAIMERIVARVADRMGELTAMS